MAQLYRQHVLKEPSEPAPSLVQLKAPGDSAVGRKTHEVSAGD
jgi:hypothetical protein